MGRRAILGLFAALACAAAAEPALAANATVRVGNGRTLSPTAVTVRPSNTVTWQWVGPDTDHSIVSQPAGQLENWDSDPVTQNPSRGVGGTFVKSFTQLGTFSYVCRVHPDDMQGTVTVTSAPEASFTISPPSPFTDEPVTLDGSGSTDTAPGNVATYEWDLDGIAGFEVGPSATATTLKEFPAAGTVPARLRVIDNSGQTDVVTRNVVVRSRAPVASFTATPPTAAKGQTVTFNAGASTDPDDAIASYAWDLDGNGSFETDTGAVATTSRMYTAAGPVLVGLRVTDAAIPAHTGTTTRTITVTNALPTASFVATPAAPLSLEAVSFDAAGSADPDAQPGDPALSYRWDFENNGVLDTAASTTPTTTHAYPTPGPKTVRVQVTDGEGGVSQATQGITIGNRGPSAAFTSPEKVTAGGAAAEFNGAGSADPDGTIVRYEWDLDGDGVHERDTGATPTVSQAYTTPGTVQVRLRVTDASGAIAEVAHPLTVDPAPAVAVVPPGPAPAAPAAPVAAAPAPAATPRAPAALTLTGSTRQRAARARGVKVTVACPGRCALTARGTIAIAGGRGIRLVEARRTLTAAGRATLTLKVAARDLGRLRRALARRNRAVTITVTSRAGSVTRTGRRRITLVR